MAVRNLLWIVQAFVMANPLKIVTEICYYLQSNSAYHFHKNAK